MVHTVVAKKQVEEVLKGLRTSKQIQVGLLIGQVTKLKEYVLQVARTPTLEELGDNDSSTNQMSGPFQDWWVLEHARQVISLLPGGLSVIGLFCVCSKETLPQLQPRLAKLLRDLYSLSGCLERPHTKYILLHSCSALSRNKAFVFDVEQTQGGFWPAEIKFQSNPVQLVKVESALRLNFDLYECIHGNNTAELLKSVQEFLKSSIVDIFSRTLFKVNGRIVENEGDPLVIKTRKAEQEAINKGVAMSLLTRQTVQAPSGVQTVPHFRRFTLKGVLPLQAFLHSKATCGEAFKAIEADAVRNLTARLVALTESNSLQDSEDGCSTPLPSRVSVSVPTIPWVFSEYSLPGEDHQECECRVCDLLGVDTAKVVTLEQQSLVTLAADTSEVNEMAKVVTLEQQSLVTLAADTSEVNETNKQVISTQMTLTWTAVIALTAVIVAVVIGAVLYL